MPAALGFDAGLHPPSFQPGLNLCVPGRPVFEAKRLPRFQRPPRSIRIYFRPPQNWGRIAAETPDALQVSASIARAYWSRNQRPRTLSKAVIRKPLALASQVHKCSHRSAEKGVLFCVARARTYAQPRPGLDRFLTTS